MKRTKKLLSKEEKMEEFNIMNIINSIDHEIDKMPKNTNWSNFFKMFNEDINKLYSSKGKYKELKNLLTN